MVMRNGSDRYDAVVVGGGFYGARLAILLASRGKRILLAERESTLLTRASLRNQARVHNGYHYPRSILTSLRSRLNYSRFLDEYAECIDNSFPHYYAVARGMSKVTAGQFIEFCKRIGAPLSRAPEQVVTLFDRTRIDGVFEAQECAFDAAKLRNRLSMDLVSAGVDVRLGTIATRVWTERSGTALDLEHAGDISTIEAELVLNCTYSHLNGLLHRSGAQTIPAKHELTEMALVQPPSELAGAAVTVMDGPFFSLMPYPSRGLFTLSHVRYTPHRSWMDAPNAPVVDNDDALLSEPSRFVHMVRDAERYLPVMRHARYVESIFETKTVLPRSEQDDSRPILLRRSTEHPALISVLGAKIDSVYDVEDALSVELGFRRSPVAARASSLAS